jgi:hypothetical protein
MTSCQVRWNVSKAEPRRVDAPVLYTTFMDCRCDTGNEYTAPRRLLRCSSLVYALFKEGTPRLVVMGLFGVLAATEVQHIIERS